MTSTAPIAGPYLGGAAVGLILGALVIWLGLPAPAAEPATATAAAAPSPSICDLEPDPIEPLREQAEQAELHARVLRGQIALLGGIPEPWPDGTDLEAERARVVAAVRSALDEHGYGQDHAVDVRTDCSEDPCIVQVVAGPAETAAAVRMSIAQEQALLSAIGKAGFQATERTFDGEPEHWYVLTLFPRASETTRAERTRVRTERLHREVRP